jgi:Rieske Fe-S protein
VRAIDARCTHLGCNVRFREGEFRCPCHNGVFDAEGNPVSGPVTDPLERMPTRIRNGVVEGEV